MSITVSYLQSLSRTGGGEWWGGVGQSLIIYKILDRKSIVPVWKGTGK